MGEGKHPRQDFAAMAQPSARARREGLPHPERVVRTGILTKEVLDWMEARSPATPSPERHIDDAQIRRDAAEEAQAKHRERINALRRALSERPEKAKRDFGVARDYQRPQHER
jgi:hypothetical protein